MYYWTFVAVVVVAVCSCERERSKPIEPEPVIPEPVIPEPETAVATTPEQLMHNLARAMRDRDKALYETLLNEDFWFNETDCLGYIVFDNDLETELNIIIGSRDGSTKGLFDIFSDFSYDFELIRRWQELGSEYPRNIRRRPRRPSRRRLGGLLRPSADADARRERRWVSRRSVDDLQAATGRGRGLADGALAWRSPAWFVWCRQGRGFVGTHQKHNFSNRLFLNEPDGFAHGLGHRRLPHPLLLVLVSASHLDLPVPLP